jgi:hypothetical protein
MLKIEQLLGVLTRESCNPWRSLIVFRTKKNGEYSLCIDYRRLNDVTIKDSYPMPRADEILDELSGARVFSKLDPLSGYHQIDMRKEDIEKTAFACREGLFEFVEMPFGLVNGPATFKRVMNKILRMFLNNFTMVYMDDIIVYRKDEDSHRKHVEQVVKTLTDVGLQLNTEKCEYHKKELQVLGHVISAEDIKVDPERIKAIQAMETPKSKKELESLLGMTNCCSRFINNVTENTTYLYS